MSPVKFLSRCFAVKNSTILFLDTRTAADAESMLPVLSFVKGVCASTVWILCIESLELSELERHVLAWIICRFLCDSMCDVTRSFSFCLSMALRDQSSNLCLYLSVRTLSASGSAVVPLHFSSCCLGVSSHS